MAPVRPGPEAGAGLSPLLRLPLHAPGLRIGLFGGSFNPPHAGHRDASLLALKRLRLDAVWWLVTPGNPLKDTAALPSLNQRIAAAQALAAHPRIHATGIEAALGTRYTADTIDALIRRCPGARFVWLMGADNLAQFHRWQRWRSIAGRVPIAVIDRPTASLQALAAPAAQALKRYRIGEAAAAGLPTGFPPAWVFLHGLKSPLSSTLLRSHSGKH